MVKAGGSNETNKWHQNSAGDWVCERGMRDAYITRFGAKSKQKPWRWQVCEGKKIVASGNASTDGVARVMAARNMI